MFKKQNQQSPTPKKNPLLWKFTANECDLLFPFPSASATLILLQQSCEGICTCISFKFTFGRCLIACVWFFLRWGTHPNCAFWEQENLSLEPCSVNPSLFRRLRYDPAIVNICIAVNYGSLKTCGSDMLYSSTFTFYARRQVWHRSNSPKDGLDQLLRIYFVD